MTTSYTTGTVSVSVGSDIVTGTGTGWFTSNIAPGILGLDSANGNPVPVAEIISDTSLRLVTPWRGASASGQAYWLSYDTRDGQQTVNNAQRLAEYIALLRSSFFSAFQGVAPASDKLPYFGAGGAGALADFTAAARALLAGGVLPNSQLPQRLRTSTVNQNVDANTLVESGNYFLLSGASNVPTGTGNWYIQVITQNNGGFASQQGIKQFAYGNDSNQVWMRYIWYQGWTAWKRADPPERGSNANGEYTRFSDGTQICWSNLLTSASIAAGATVGFDWNYPVGFSDGNISIQPGNYTLSGSDANPPYINVAIRNAPTSTSCRIVARNDAPAAAFGANIRATAIGRWY